MAASIRLRTQQGAVVRSPDLRGMPGFCGHHRPVARPADSFSSWSVAAPPKSRADESGVLHAGRRATVTTSRRDRAVEEEVARWLREHPESGFRDVDDLAAELLRRWARARGIDEE